MSHSLPYRSGKSLITLTHSLVSYSLHWPTVCVCWTLSFEFPLNNRGFFLHFHQVSMPFNLSEIPGWVLCQPSIIGAQGGHKLNSGGWGVQSTRLAPCAVLECWALQYWCVWPCSTLVLGPAILVCLALQYWSVGPCSTGVLGTAVLEWLTLQCLNVGPCSTWEVLSPAMLSVGPWSAV